MRILASSLLALFLVAASFGQSTHSAVLKWGASPDAAANPSLGYFVYRFSGQCTSTGSPVFTKLNSTPITALTYTDSGLGIGSYCYYVTSTLNGVESVPSNTAGGTVTPATVVITVTVS